MLYRVNWWSLVDFHFQVLILMECKKTIPWIPTCTLPHNETFIINIWFCFFIPIYFFSWIYNSTFKRILYFTLSLSLRRKAFSFRACIYIYIFILFLFFRFIWRSGVFSIMNVNSVSGIHLLNINTQIDSKQIVIILFVVVVIFISLIFLIN